MSRRINRNNQNYNNAIIFATNMKYTLINQNILPSYCSLMLHSHGEHPDANVVISLNHLESNYNGYVIISQLIDINTPVDGFVRMLCTIDSYNGNFIEITVNNMEEMLDVIQFCQNILVYQPPNQHNLEFIRVPNHLLNHWCVPLHVQQQNISHVEEDQNANV